MCSIVVTTRPQGDGHTDWFALSVMVGTAGCTGNPLSGMKPASDLSSHKGTDASVVTAKETKHAGNYPPHLVYTLFNIKTLHDSTLLYLHAYQSYTQVF